MMVEEPRTLTSNEHSDSKGELIRNKFHPKKSPSENDDENIPSAKNEDIVDWLAEDQKSHLPLRRKIMSNEVNVPPKSPDLENYDGSIKEWIPTPHPKIKEDDADDYVANVSDEGIVDWLAEGQKPHLPLRRKIMSQEIKLPPKSPDTEDYGESIKDWIPTPHEKIKEDEPDDSVPNVSNDELVDWLAEGQKKHEPLKRNKTRSAVDVENEKEDYSGEPLQDWIPKPHPKIKEDNDNVESFDNEAVVDWNPEAEK